MTSYWLPLVSLCLTGLGFGDSSLAILSLVFLTLSCVISIFSFHSSFFSFFSLCIFLFALCSFLHKVVFLNIYHYYLSKYIYIYIYIFIYNLYITVLLHRNRMFQLSRSRSIAKFKCFVFKKSNYSKTKLKVISIQQHRKNH